MTITVEELMQMNDMERLFAHVLDRAEYSQENFGAMGMYIPVESLYNIVREVQENDKTVVSDLFRRRLVGIAVILGITMSADITSSELMEVIFRHIESTRKV